MSNILNLRELNQRVETSRLSKIELAKRANISRVTLDSVLKGKEIGLYKFIALLNALGIKIASVFDNDSMSCIESPTGSDSGVTHSGAADVIHVDCARCGQLAEERKERIEELKERVAELRERIEELKEGR